MIAWLWNAVVGQFCRHRWDVIKRIALFEDEDAVKPCGTKWILRCSKCGDIRSKRT